MDIDKQEEAIRDRLIDGDPPEVYHACCMCGEIYHEESKVWFEPHECVSHFKQLDNDERYVCSETCQHEWLEYYWDYVEEFEQGEIDNEE